MLVQQLLVLGPGQPSGHCTQCANCCIHHICISVQVNLQQGSGTVMASFEMQRDFSYRQRSSRQMEELGLEAWLQPLGPPKQPGLLLHMRLCCGIEQMQMPDSRIVTVVSPVAKGL